MHIKPLVRSIVQLKYLYTCHTALLTKSATDPLSMSCRV